MASIQEIFSAFKSGLSDSRFLDSRPPGDIPAPAGYGKMRPMTPKPPEPRPLTRFDEFTDLQGVVHQGKVRSEVGDDGIRRDVAGKVHGGEWVKVVDKVEQKQALVQEQQKQAEGFRKIAAVMQPFDEKHPAQMPAAQKPSAPAPKPPAPKPAPREEPLSGPPRTVVVGAPREKATVFTHGPTGLDKEAKPWVRDENFAIRAAQEMAAKASESVGRRLEENLKGNKLEKPPKPLPVPNDYVDGRNTVLPNKTKIAWGDNYSMAGDDFDVDYLHTVWAGPQPWPIASWTGSGTDFLFIPLDMTTAPSYRADMPAPTNTLWKTGYTIQISVTTGPVWRIPIV
jgi:hypothetical protein